MIVIDDMNNTGIDFRLLQCFSALMAARSVSRAAANLNLSQPAMSHALGRLRRLFDDPLLLKTHDGMAPTSRALELESRVRDLLAEAARLTHKSTPFAPASARATLTVMAPEYVEYLMAPALARRLQEDAPGVEIAFRVSDPERALEQLARGELDARLGWWPAPAPQLRYKLLFRDRLVCIARKGHPQLRGNPGAEALLAARHVRVQRPRTGVSMQALDQAVAAQRRELQVALHVQSAFALAAAVAASDLAATVTERLAQQLAAQFPLQVLPLPPALAVPNVRVALYWHERSHQQPAHRWFRQLITDSARNL